MVGKGKKTLVTIGSTCSFQICSADAVRFVRQILHGGALTLVVIYYNIETPGMLLRDDTIRVYNIDSQLNAIWGGYKTTDERVDLVKRIEELSILFSKAQDGIDVGEIARNIDHIKRRAKSLQAEMKKKKTLFKIAPKISSKCGKEIGSCKHQCRLQAVLNVKNLSLAGQLTTDPGSPTSIRGKGASFSSFGVAKPPASAKTPVSARSARGQSGKPQASAKTPASARGPSGKPPASVKPPASTTSARGKSAKTPASTTSARGKSAKTPVSKISNVRRQSGIPGELTGLDTIPENTLDLEGTGHADTYML